MELPVNTKCLIKKEEKEGYESATIPMPTPIKDEVLIRVTKVFNVIYWICKASN